jgi:signal transduction histidine kinase
MQNAMRFEEISNFNITLQEKIERATRELRRTNEKLRALDEAKDEFISMASHQLRTPLTSVKGYVSMVLEGDAGPLNEMQRKLLEQSFISSQRMVYLIADLLNVSRLKTGKFVIEPKVTHLPDVVESEVNQLLETAQGRQLQLIYEKPAHFPQLWMDETKIRQVIMNFIDNAIYYTPAGGHINVSLFESEESIAFTVTDDGIGVPRHDQHHLFTKFYRAGNARKARPDGTGLGLFMAKKVIVAQGGALIFHSAEGKGSTFGFTFPKAKLKVPERPPALAGRAAARKV